MISKPAIVVPSSSYGDSMEHQHEIYEIHRLFRDRYRQISTKYLQLMSEIFPIEARKISQVEDTQKLSKIGTL